jgi:hypothetical protein
LVGSTGSRVLRTGASGWERVYRARGSEKIATPDALGRPGSRASTRPERRQIAGQYTRHPPHAPVVEAVTQPTGFSPGLAAR